MKYIFSSAFIIGAIIFVFAGYGFHKVGIKTSEYIFFAGGAIFLIIALVAPFLNWGGQNLSVAEKAQLKSSGQVVWANFKALDRRWGIKLNGQSPIVIYAQDDKGITYQSEDLWFSGADSSKYNDPAFIAWQRLQAIDSAKKYTLPVYVDPANAKNYYMDVAGLQIK